ncbi:N-acetylmuramoyl-L-alanine amidase [Sphingomonas sp.]|uniref:N-acetylmuramoyl-L-alanine amidase n=1 Tax=Sphingomonas sp. TaxID=28214 RepID=UPI000DBC3602|nr:N-acetylmuramoyl-L-alanine amidase [Sphingomonas sp.]PZT91980.1 MAG: N-acetylmuramoyl-L-alanine amidase [Sphingomonas sp.]
MTTATPAWRAAASAPIARAITSIAVHCTATREGQPFHVADVRAWHKAQGWNDIGYHFLVALDGTIEIGRPKAQVGAHVAGHNAKSIGIVYVGGVAKDGRTPKDSRTPEQKAAMVDLLRVLKAAHPGAVIQGHRDYPKVAKACPSFDAKREYATL